MKLDEGGLSRVISRAKDKKQSHATVSAERGDKSKKENKARSKQLEKDLRGRGYGPKKTTGTYSEKDSKTGKETKVKERSYFVTSGKKGKRKFKKDMKKVAAKHNQDSVLVKQKGSSTAKLHATRKGGLGKSKSATAGKLKAKKGEFSTQVGKKHMTYESILNKAEVLRQEFAEGKKKGLWDNIHAKRKRGEAPAKKGDKDYPKTLNVEGTSYGLYKGDGKPKGAMKNFLDKRAAAKKKKKVKHDCSSKVKHEEYGIGDCIKEMHTLDEYGDITHYDVLFSHGVEKNVPVKNLTSLVSEMHEHYINDDKNAEVAEAKVDMKTPDYKRATVRDKRYGNPHGSHELGGGIRKDRRADHEARRGVKKEEIEMTRKEYNKLHKDFKSDDPKNPRTTRYVKGKGTVSSPVKFVGEEKKEKNCGCGQDPCITYGDHRHKKDKVTEAKVDKGRSDYGKASIRNYRRKGPGHGDPGMFDPSGKRGKTIDLRRKEHEARRGKKGAKVPAYKVEHHQKDKDGNTIPHEDLNELKTSTLLSYTQKATNRLAFDGDGKKKAIKRAKGVKNAAGKLAMRATDPDGSMGFNKNPKNEDTIPSKNFSSFMESAWQRKEGKNKTGGLNEKGRKSYERENPGSDLKAPQPEGGPRKKSFCARMGGVKGPMKKPNGEPTRKALALRKWKC